jgi:hypothetical protein
VYRSICRVPWSEVACIPRGSGGGQQKHELVYRVGQRGQLAARKEGWVERARLAVAPGNPFEHGNDQLGTGRLPAWLDEVYELRLRLRAMWLGAHSESVERLPPRQRR